MIKKIHSMTSRKHNYASLIVDSLSTFKKVAGMFASEWIFRGHEKASWDISTSLERDSTRLERSHFAAFEAFSIEQIKAHELREKYDQFSWLALLQHHGCKTRLVDFTEAIQVALYFAFRDSPDQHDLCLHSAGAIWAIQKEALETKVTELAKRSKLRETSVDLSRRLVNKAICNNVQSRRDEGNKLGVVCCKPATDIERMSAQKGLFVAPLNLSYSFKENLTTGLDLTGSKEPVLYLKSLDDLRAALEKESVIKLRLPKSLRKKLLAYLRDENITEETLFPGLDGYVRNLNYETRWMEDAS